MSDVDLAQGAVACDPCNGELVINGISLHQEPAWCCWDLFPIWFGDERKGTGLVEQPAADGAWAYAQRRKSLTVTLPLALSGYYATDGSRYTDEWVGLQTNLEYLRENLFDMRSSGTPVASWDATLTMPNSDERTATVQLGPLQIGKNMRAVFLCSFQLTIIEGAFT